MRLKTCLRLLWCCTLLKNLLFLSSGNGFHCIIFTWFVGLPLPTLPRFPCCSSWSPSSLQYCSTPFCSHGTLSPIFCDPPHPFLLRQPFLFSQLPFLGFLEFHDLWSEHSKFRTKYSQTGAKISQFGLSIFLIELVNVITEIS